MSTVGAPSMLSQVLNYRVIVQGHTPYQDHEAAERRRHLVRLWLRAGDRRQFRG